MRGSKLIFKYVSSVVILSIFLVGCSIGSKKVTLQEPVEEKNDVVAEKPYEVKKGDINKLISCNGEYIASKRQSLSFKCKEGYFREFKIKEGRSVKKGELLAELDTEEIIDKIEIQELVLKKTQIKYDEAKAAKEDESIIKQTEIELEEERFKLQLLKEELEGCKLVAPFDGIVQKLEKFSCGQKIWAQSVITIIDNKGLFIMCTGKDIAKYKIGMKVNFANKDKEFTGEIVSVTYDLKEEEEEEQNKANGDKDGIKLKNSGYVVVKIDNSKIKADIGQNVDINLILSKKENVLVIPKTYLIVKNGFTYVKRLDNDTEEEKMIEVGLETDNLVEVVSGLKEGDKITFNSNKDTAAEKNGK